MRKIFIFIIKTYQFTIAPYFGNCCRFNPTCSEYSIQAFRKFGVFKGVFLTVKRIVKCNPYHPGGNDPIP
ncbi:MAG: membrane protein insertion efficiency factor YidD [Chlamydiae bacterium]|nr:membrane protein insertion efficiency factor YidD [Chlamydiota bacterium]